jgi:nitrous oxidase accessory protein NosD
MRRTLLLLATMALTLLVASGLALAAGVGSAAADSSVVGPGESIQKAVNAADPGDTIVVRGVHHEAVVIRKDGIKLVGQDAVLKSPDEPRTPCFEAAGFCVLGGVNFQTGAVSDYVQDVTITGFTIRGFEGFGIVALGARNAKFAQNRAFDNGEYGITAFASKGTQVLANTTSGSGEAGIYIGDSPRANATVAANDTYGNLFGIFVRNARGGSISANHAHNNCAGMMVLADAPGPAGNFGVRANIVRNNTRSCPAGEEGPSLSGIGIALWGARDMEIEGNTIVDNVPSGPSEFHGGVALVGGFGGTAPQDNLVRGNTILRNRPDIFWDKSGSGNRFVGNVCNTSVPTSLCN